VNPLEYEDWLEVADPAGVIHDPLVVAFDVSPERKAALVIAGRRRDGLVQGELVESKSGTDWVAPEVARLVKEHKMKAICDGRGPASRLAPELANLGVEVEQLSATEHSQACGQLLDAIDRRAIRHLDDPELNGAVRAAKTRPLGDAWAWSRRDSSSNIAPLVAFTLAVSAASTREQPRKVAFAWA
jgi:phage terminase large subunit-like protein